ncbi:hypothetical protein ACEYW6_10205 [Nostoc sp. UIC 10607]|uniref:Uncharacterized protein n=1 Tax=Nostoc linckia FACHB-391 TaxID=2692906 RepID=A0ABR8F4P3_NOSLI|nr:hypothetical protein [Nostoc foliaceum]MBD2564247.1 hypothetical protein [Nostoc linckia FACHB-391]
MTLPCPLDHSKFREVRSLSNPKISKQLTNRNGRNLRSHWQPNTKTG